MDPTDLAKLACNDSEKAVFESLSRVAVHVNLLPFSSSPAERSVSTLNRVMTELRTCLTDDHLDDLMMISVEGPVIHDLRSDVGKNAWPEYTEFITRVYNRWIPQRRVY